MYYCLQQLTKYLKCLQQFTKINYNKTKCILCLFLQNLILAFAISQKIEYNFKHTTIFHIDNLTV